MRSPDPSVSQLVDHGVGIDRGFRRALLQGDQRFTDHVHARRERAGGTHGLQPLPHRLDAACTGDLRVGMEQADQCVDVPLIDGAGIALQERPYGVMGGHNTATGLTGHPVPLTIRSGLMAKRNSQRPAAAQRSLSAASAMLSIKCRPTAVIPI